MCPSRGRPPFLWGGGGAPPSGQTTNPQIQLTVKNILMSPCQSATRRSTNAGRLQQHTNNAAEDGECEKIQSFLKSLGFLTVFSASGKKNNAPLVAPPTSLRSPSPPTLLFFVCVYVLTLFLLTLAPPSAVFHAVR